MALDSKPALTWVVSLATAVISVGGAYLTAKTTAQSAIAVAAQSSNVEMTKLALNVLSDPSSNKG
ncbi:hypothetical protein FJ936_09205 [Mesorhizobium sp. B2-4-13]|uniref:hypothetical protein n=1 Tax=Mesorhizobium sp. B2-4-13 TaxID=2589936 RepID=UPI001153C872|nr:hypothetical protein [Mesorhizobium sp. B2-4-13]TPK85705.1 hypothetical protein FJ936_09205 [Mesorhizobium sp. B2-4-13]